MASAVTQKALNPKPFLTKLVGQDTLVKLKWGLEYRGKLKTFDDYMNLELQDSSEYVHGEFKQKLGSIFIRCNNVLYVRPDPDAESNKEAV